MLEQVSTSVKFLAFYTASKTGKTGLTVTIDIYDPSGTQIVTAGSATALGGGLYAYTLSTDNSSEGEYAAIFKTDDSTVDAQHIPSLWVLGRAGVENLDAATSTRSVAADIPTADITAIRAATDNLPSDPADQSLVEAAISALTIPTATDIRTEMDSNSTKLANLDVSVSSRLALADYTAPSTPPTAGAIADEVRVELAAELANLDAPVSGATAPSASTVATAVRTELATELARVDAAISTRLADADYVAPANSDVTAVKAVTDALNTERLANVATTAIVGNLIAQANS
jgi:hypothetical protein